MKTLTAILILLATGFAAVALAQESPQPTVKVTGKGHPFVCTDYSGGKIFIVSADGKVEWRCDGAQNANDIWVLPNGNLLFLTGKPDAANPKLTHMGVREVTRDKKVVFDYQSDGEIYACQRLANGNTFIAESSTGRLLEVDPKGTVVKEIKLLPEGKASGGHSGFMRNARKLENGHYLVAHFSAKAVKEYDENGKLVLTIPAPGGPHSVIRLKNGHTLISSGDAKLKGVGQQGVMEVDEKGAKIWEVTAADVPGFKFMGGMQVLPNGNLVVANWQGHLKNSAAPQLFEITRDKKVVWTYSNLKDMKTISSVQLLDVKGDVTKGEIAH